MKYFAGSGRVFSWVCVRVWVWWCLCKCNQKNGRKFEIRTPQKLCKRLGPCLSGYQSMFSAGCKCRVCLKQYYSYGFSAPPLRIAATPTNLQKPQPRCGRGGFGNNCI